jgi:hypothetical protein
MRKFSVSMLKQLSVPNSIDPFQGVIVNLHRSALLQKFHGDQQSLLTVALENCAFQTNQRSAANTNSLARFKSRFGTDRNTGVDQAVNLSQVLRKLRAICDRNAPRNAVCGQCGAAPIVVSI